MSLLTPEIASEVKELARKNADEIAGALGRAFGGSFAILPDTVQTVERANVESELRGPGLVCVFHVGGSGAMAFLPEASGLVPAWTGTPDVSGTSKLNTLALELGVLMLPEAFMPDDNSAARVEQMQAAVENAAIPANAGVMSLTVRSGELQGTLWVLWPVGNPTRVFEAATKDSAGASGAATAESASQHAKAKSAAAMPTSTRFSYESMEDGLRILPEYTRSLLKIKIPVTVTLASTKQPVSKILEIVPGSIIQFSKSCEDPLSVEVGGQEIAVGETVKVGDKFGLRVTSIVMPEERFLTLRGKKERS